MSKPGIQRIYMNSASRADPGGMKWVASHPPEIQAY